MWRNRKIWLFHLMYPLLGSYLMLEINKGERIDRR